MSIRISQRYCTSLLTALLLALPAISLAQQSNTTVNLKESAPATSDLTAAVERLARVGSASAPSFSPDGKWISFIANLSGTPQVWIIPAAGGYPRMVTNGNDPVTQAEWSPTSDWIAVGIAPGGGLNTQIYVVKPDGTRMRRLTDGGQDNNAFDVWSEDGRQLIMNSSRRDPASRDSYSIDVESGNITLLAKNPGVGSVESLTRDAQWALLSRLRNRGSNDLYLLDMKTKKETLLTEHTGPGEFFGQLSPDGKTLYFATNKDRDTTALARMRLSADGAASATEMLAETKVGELDGIQLNKQGTLAALLWNIAGRTELELFDTASSKSRRIKLPGELAGGVAFSNDGKQLALAVIGSAQPSDIWLMNIGDIPGSADAHSASDVHFRQLTFSPHPGVDMNALVKPEPVTFNAHDGLELSGWLYRPQSYVVGSRTPGMLPFVISFHGGPEGQERPVFRSDYQALLSQGIGVFAPNVRGSSGFGKKFVNLDNGELRFNGIKDIKSCVDFLVKNGIADPKRIGITGGSYGGYMTMAGLTEYPDLFAAGVDLFGIVNFATFFQHTQPWMAAISKIEYGDPDTQKDMLDRLSPIYKLDRIKAATMVQHGANDTNVPVIEAEQIVKTLKARGVPVEYILFPDEGHGWRKIPNRIRSTVEMVRFFKEHLAAPVQAAGGQ